MIQLLLFYTNYSVIRHTVVHVGALACESRKRQPLLTIYSTRVDFVLSLQSAYLAVIHFVFDMDNAASLSDTSAVSVETDSYQEAFCSQSMGVGILLFQQSVQCCLYVSYKSMASQLLFYPFTALKQHLDGNRFRTDDVIGGSHNLISSNIVRVIKSGNITWER
jgi:hypothetical protein